MKGLFYLIIFIALGSAIWWYLDGSTPLQQVEYIKSSMSDSFAGEKTSNATESASKLGKVLKDNFNEAQQVYEHGAEAKYE